MHQDATPYGGRFSPGKFVLDGDPALLHKKGGGAPSPILMVEIENFKIGPGAWGTSGYS